MRRTLTALALAAIPVLAACDSEATVPAASGTDDAPATSAAPPARPASESSPLPDAEAYVREGILVASACDLLGVADVEKAVEGLGWGVVDDAPAQCVYQDPDATHTVTLTVVTRGQFDLAKNYPGMEGLGDRGLMGIAEAETYAALWTPTGAEGAVVLEQWPAVIDSQTFAGLVEIAGLAYENAPRA